MAPKDHWDRVYSSKAPDRVSWYQPHDEPSLRLIQATGCPRSAAIVDVGAGASTLVDDLLDLGYSQLTVLDLSSRALDAARSRLGSRASRVRWIEADVLDAGWTAPPCDIWHDRAVFHFLTTELQRRAYVEALLRVVRPGGHVIVATFAEDGPTHCSGLPVMRYSADALHAEFGAGFLLVGHERDSHRTPAGAVQSFVYCYCRVRDA